MNYLIRYKNWLTLLFLLSLFRVTGQDISYKNFHDSQFGRNLLAFDTEREVLLRLDYEGSPLAGKGLKIYSAQGDLITSGSTDRAGLFSLPNRAYKELEVRVEGGISPHRVKLHGITPKSYRLFAIYNSRNEGVLKISGILQRGSAAELPEQLTLDIYDSSDRFIGGKKIKVRASGYFETDLNRRGFTLQSYHLIFRVNGRQVKGYRLYQNSLEFAPFTNEGESPILKVENRVVFPGDELRLQLREPADKIESLIYSFEEGEGFSRSFIYEGKLNSTMQLSLPAGRGPPVEELTLRVELLYKDSTSRVERLKVTRLNRLDRALLIEQSATSPDGYLELFSPFASAEAFIINYSRTAKKVQTVTLKEGYNRVAIATGRAPFSKSLITIWDRQTDRRLHYHFNITNRLNLKQGLTTNPIKEGNNYRLEKPRPNPLPLFIYKTAAAESLESSLVQSLENFNDFSSEQLTSLCPGEALFPLWGLIRSRVPADLPHIERLSHFTGEHFYSEEIVHEGQQRFETSCLMPVELSRGDTPQLRVNITNRGRDNHKLTIKLYSGERQLSTRSLTIEPYGIEELYLKASPINEEGSEEFILLVSEGDTVRAIHKFSIDIRKEPLQSIFTQLSGRITHNRETKLFMELPAERESAFELALYISTGPMETALYKNSIINNVTQDSFETVLLRYLKERLHLALINREASSSPLSPYFKRGGEIATPEQTALFLYTAAGGGVIDRGHYRTILNNLLKKQRKELLASPLSLFLLAELGVYLEEITPAYLNSLAQGQPLFYRYYSRLLPGSEQKALEAPLGEVYYQSYLVGEDFIETIKIMLGLAAEGGYTPNNSHRLLEDCLLTAYLLKELNKKGESSPKSAGKSELKFKSSLLGEFQTVLQGRSLFHRNYTLLKGAELEGDEELIELSFTKKGPAELFYLIESSYRAPEQVRSESGTLKTELFFSDGSGKKLPGETPSLTAGERYYINIIIESSGAQNELLLAPPNCSGLKVDYEGVLVNKDGVETVYSDKTYLALKGLKEGKNRVMIPVTAGYRGSYRVPGAKLIDIYSLDNFLNLKAYNIKID